MEKETSELIENFFSKFKTINYKKGEIIIRSEEEPAGIFFLKKGFVKMNIIFANGSEFTLNIFKPGSFFPMIWAIGGVENYYFFQTMSEVTVQRATKLELLDLLKNNPDVMFDITKRILIGMNGLLTNFQYLIFGNSINRVAAAIYICSKRFGETNKNGEIVIKIKLTHQDIANLAGMVRETASISIKKLERKGIIDHLNRLILVKDLKKLEMESKFYEKIEDEQPLI